MPLYQSFFCLHHISLSKYTQIHIRLMSKSSWILPHIPHTQLNTGGDRGRPSFHQQLRIQASTCCRSSTSSLHILLWIAASSERSAIFTARMTGSGEMAWMTPITMTYLPVTTAAGGQLLSDKRLKKQGWWWREIRGDVGVFHSSAVTIFRLNVAALGKLQLTGLAANTMLAH